MTAAVARLDRTLAETVAAHQGVRPVEQGEGDSFVVAFARGPDALACALDLQRALRSRRSGCASACTPVRPNCATKATTSGPCPTARLDSATSRTVARPCCRARRTMVVDQLPAGVWLNDLGTHGLRGLARPERVVQLCHPDLPVEFPPLRTLDAGPVTTSPAQLTSFVGREAELAEVRGPSGRQPARHAHRRGRCGKTRLAFQVAASVRRIPGRRVGRRARADHGSRRRAGHHGARARSSPTSAATRRSTRSPISSATGPSSWCWTTASTCSTPAPRWSSPSSACARR